MRGYVLQKCCGNSISISLKLNIPNLVILSIECTVQCSSSKLKIKKRQNIHFPIYVRIPHNKKFFVFKSKNNFCRDNMLYYVQRNYDYANLRRN